MPIHEKRENYGPLKMGAVQYCPVELVGLYRWCLFAVENVHCFDEIIIVACEDPNCK